MPNLIKTGSSVTKVGNNILAYNRQLNFAGAVTVLAGVGDFVRVDLPGNRLFNCNVSATAAIRIFDLSTFAVISNTLVGSTVAVDSSANILYVGTNASIKVYNATTYALITTIPVGGEYDMRIDKVGNRLFAMTRMAITILDLTTYATIYTISGLTGFNGTRIGLDLQGGRLFTSSNNNNLTIYKLSDYSLIFDALVSGISFCSGFGIDNANNRIYVPDLNLKKLFILNYTNPAAGVLATVAGASLTRPLCVDFSPSYLFVGDKNNNTISIFNNSFN
jgi:hypothetical protein